MKNVRYEAGNKVTIGAENGNVDVYEVYEVTREGTAQHEVWEVYEYTFTRERAEYQASYRNALQKKMLEEVYD